MSPHCIAFLAINFYVLKRKLVLTENVAMNTVVMLLTDVICVFRVKYVYGFFYSQLITKAENNHKKNLKI